MYRPRHLGALGQETYGQALWAIVSHPLTAEQVVTGNPTFSAIGSELLGGLLSANAGGYVTADQKANGIAQDAQARVKASGGTLSLADATAQASQDWTNVLSQTGADPSQNPVNPANLLPTIPTIPTWVWWVLAGLGVVVVIEIVR